MSVASKAMSTQVSVGEENVHVRTLDFEIEAALPGRKGSNNDSC